MRPLLPLVLLAVAPVAGCDPPGDVRTGGGAADAGRTASRVERVVDGDTLVLRGVGKARLIGVDTPEVFGGVECFGRAASAYARRVVDGRRVTYRPGVEPRDRYGRALVYVWLRDGRFFNQMLVREGFAQPLTIPPNVEYADRFVRAARAARRERRGLWQACGGAR